MANVCIICGCSGTILTQCKDLSSWSTLYQAAVIRNHEKILAISQNEGVFSRNMCQVSSVVQSLVHFEKRFRKD